MPNTNLLSDLLCHGAWAQRLAAQLLDGAEQADLLQETWVAASARPGPAAVPARQWLGAVMRNLARMQRRSSGRRRQRERTQGALLHGQAQARPDDLAEKTEAQRRLADSVLGLAPIYRDVVVLRFYDDLSTDEIAARLAIPPGTARRRLTVAIEQLRAQLEAAHADWRASLGVLVVSGKPRPGPGRSGRATNLPALAGVVAALCMVAQPATSSSSLRQVATPRGPAQALPKFAVSTADDLTRTTGPRGSAATPVPSAGEWLIARAEAAERYQIPLGTGPLRGPSSAKVTILEFVDYQCPFTARAARDFEEVLARHASDVRFGVIHRPLVFHRDASMLAKAALAADAQGRFWPMHAALLGRTRRAWTPELVLDEARALGLDPARFAADLAADATSARLASDQAAAQSAGIDGVPVFFINGRPLVGADAPSSMAAIIAEEVARADHLIATGADAAHIYNAVIASGKTVALSSRAPTRKPDDRASGDHGYEGLFMKAGGCAPPLPAPAALDFATEKGSDGKHFMLAWSLAASGLDRYETWYRPREKSVTLSSKTAGPGDFVAEHQTVVAKSYVGKVLRFRAEVKSEDVVNWAGLFLRAEGDDDRIVTSQRTRLMPADRGWHAAEVTVAVPIDARALSYGLILAGPGTAAMRNVAVEIVR